MGIVLFDGACNLCNNSVQFCLKRDAKGTIKYASLQSEFGQKFLKERGLNLEDFSTFYYFIPGIAYYSKSTAALKVMKEFGGIYSIASTVLSWLPIFFRDSCYTLIAKNRISLFGENKSCLMPKPEWKDRFID